MAANTNPQDDPTDDALDDEDLNGEASDGRLRSAMLDDGQPGVTWWIPIPGILVALTWAAYQAVSAEEPGLDALLQTLTWPGAAIFLVTTLVTYFGWRLDLD